MDADVTVVKIQLNAILFNEKLNTPNAIERGKRTDFSCYPTYIAPQKVIS